MLLVEAGADDAVEGAGDGLVAAVLLAQPAVAMEMSRSSGVTRSVVTFQISGVIVIGTIAGLRYPFVSAHTARATATTIARGMRSAPSRR